MSLQPKCYSYIRFSTAEQLKGDSVRRQIKMSEEWAEKHGLPLDDTLRFKDLGRSAYTGEHRAKGALGRFLKLVEEGQIARGSVLLVEHFDRLSREQVLDAFGQFSEIINRGIKVVTLSDSMEYDKESLNANSMQLMVSIMFMLQAHEESKTKSKRLKEAWIGKRINIHENKLTARAPAWLETSRDGKGAIKRFIPIKEKCQVVELIFEKKLAGKGSERIERELNQIEGIWKPKNGWRKSYINKILRNRAVIGEFQPHVKQNGKRIPEGEPVKNYYPQIISEDMFYQVQDLIKRNTHYGGKNGTISNLFGHIAKCGYCGAPMRVLNKGTLPKGGTYLVCDNAMRGMGCYKYPIRYDEFENLILTYCKGLEPQDILANENQRSRLSYLQSKLSSIDGELSQINSKIENLESWLEKTKYADVSKNIDERLNKCIQNKKDLGREREEAEIELEKVSKAGEDTETKLASIRELFDFMAKKQGKELIDLRLGLRDAIRVLIEKIVVYPVGEPLWTEEYLVEHGDEICEELMDQGWEFEDIEKYINKAFDSIDNTHYRTFVIYFHSRAFRVIIPRLDDKLAMDGERKNIYGAIPVYLDMSIG